MRVLLALVLAGVAALAAVVATFMADAWRWREEYEREKSLAQDSLV